MYRPSRLIRRGAATLTAVKILAISGALMASAVAVRPIMIAAAATDEPTREVASDAAHEQIAQLLAGLIGGSHQVLAVNPPGETPFLEVVLWLEDGANRGTIDPDELVILVYRPSLRSVELHSLAPDTELPGAAPRGYGPNFCTWWRTRPETTRRILGRQIESMKVDLIGSDERGGDSLPATLRIALTWIARSTDAPDRATIPIDARLREAGP